MTSVFPDALDALAVNKINDTVSANDHAPNHNNANAAINAIEAYLLAGQWPALVIAAANSPAGMQEFADYVCVGTVSNKVDHLTFATALAALPATGGKIVLCPGDYYVSVKTTITTPYTQIEGSGWATVIHADGITGDNIVNSPGNVLSFEGAADGGTVRNLKVDLMGTSQHGIVFNAVDYCKAESCWVTSSVDTNGAGIKAIGSGDGTPARFITFKGNFLSDCCSSITLDYEIEKASVFGNVIERAKGDIGSGISVHDMTAATGATGVNITGNVVSHTHHGIVMQDAVNSTITGNTVISEAGGDRAIGIGACDRITVVGNTLVGLGAGGDQAIILAAATRCTVAGNHLYTWTTGILGDGTALNNVVQGNHFENVTTPVSGLTLANGNTFRQNRGYVTEASGTATIAGGQTSVPVTHGLAFTPALKDIQVTPTNFPTNNVRWRITAPTATQFTIEMESDPGVSTATFVWQAAIY